MIAPLLLALVLAPAIAVAPAPGDAAKPESTATQRIIVRTNAAEFESLRAELSTRWPGAQVLPYGTAAFEQIEGQSFVYLEIIGEPVGDAPVAITLVMSDGRAYLRRVVLSDAARARVLAVAIANLLGAVDDEDVPPDRINVAVPTPLDVPEPIADVPVTPPTPPVITAPPEPTTEPAVDRVPPRAPPRARGRGWRVGVRGDLVLLLGLAPATRRGRPAFGGQLGLDVRAPRGLAFGAGVRVAGDADGDFRLVRTRIAPWIGYVARVRRLELEVGAGPTLEPWRLRTNGAGLTLASRDGGGWTILYGAAIKGGLGWWTPLATRTPSSLRLGVTAELAMSAQSTGKSVLIRLQPNGPELFSLGGIELALAAQAVWWFDLGARRRGPRVRESPAK